MSRPPISMDKQDRLLRMRQEGASVATIAWTMQMHRQTVRKYLKAMGFSLDRAGPKRVLPPMTHSQLIAYKKVRSIMPREQALAMVLR